MLTAIIDSASGNLPSAAKAFQRMATEDNRGDVIVTSDPDVILGADRIVLPGDGAFPACHKELFDHKGIFEAVEETVIKQGKPFLGICIGLQMLATVGREYTDTNGFDWIGGEVVHIAPSDPALKVPHMGWNDMVIDNPHPVLDGISSGDHTYFVHSYHFKVADPAHRLAHVNYGEEITAMIGRDNMIGMQFHPEKSQGVGLRLISNFLKWAP
jgi:glutamine amidotransferase